MTMTKTEKLQYLDSMRNSIYPSKNELYRMAVSYTDELEMAQRVLFKNKVKGKFNPLRYIASGSFSKVFLCEDAEGQVCVLKLSLIGTELDYKACISELNAQKIREEKNLKSIVPYIKGTSSIYEARQTSCLGYMPLQFVMPLGISFKIFLNNLLEGRKLTLKEATFLIYNVFTLIRELHSHNIVHRDIKLENLILMISESEKTQLMLSDFGTLRPFVSKGMYTQKVQTPIYTPCRLRNGDYSELTIEQSKKHDVYAGGIIAYQILDSHIIKNTTDAKYEMLAHPKQLPCPKNCNQRLWKMLKQIICNGNNIDQIPDVKEVCKILEEIMFEVHTKQYIPNTSRQRKSSYEVHESKSVPKSRYGRQNNNSNLGYGAGASAGFKPKQNEYDYGFFQAPKKIEHKKKKSVYGEKSSNPPQGGFRPKKNTGSNVARERKNMQSIIDSLLD